MKHLLTIITLSLGLLAVAHAEYRTIAIEVLKNEKKQVVVNIHSAVKSEHKKGISIDEASRIIKAAKGWGSSVGVAIKVNKVSLAEYLPLLKTISENSRLGLEGLYSRFGVGYGRIMKHYKIEQDGDPDS